MTEKLNQSLDLRPYVPEAKDVVIHVEQHADPVDNDFDYARKNMYDLAEKASEAIEDLVELSKGTQDPRVYRVLNELMGNAIALNKGLLELSKAKQEIKQPKKGAEEQPQGESKVVNNNLFVGTTADLQAMLEKLNNGEVKDGTNNQ